MCILSQDAFLGGRMVTGEQKDIGIYCTMYGRDC